MRQAQPSKPSGKDSLGPWEAQYALHSQGLVW